MASVRILAWKGIPAQVKASDPGQRPVSVALPDWFSQEIDRVAMRDGMADSDAYLAAWEWSSPVQRPGSPAEVANDLAHELAAAHGHPFSAAGETQDGPPIG